MAAACAAARVAWTVFAARAPASATLAVAQLVMRGHAKADADAAVAAAGVDVDAAHAWIVRKHEGAA